MAVMMRMMMKTKRRDVTEGSPGNRCRYLRHKSRLGEAKHLTVAAGTNGQRHVVQPRQAQCLSGDCPTGSHFYNKILSTGTRIFQCLAALQQSLTESQPEATQLNSQPQYQRISSDRQPTSRCIIASPMCMRTVSASCS